MWKSDTCNQLTRILQSPYLKPEAYGAPPSSFLAPHTSSRDLAELAAKARPALLVLYHQLIWTSTEEELLKELRAGYKGRVVSGRDLDVY